MSLIKALILSNALDPTVTLEELIDAFGRIEAIERGGREQPESEWPDESDAFTRRFVVTF